MKGLVEKPVFFKASRNNRTIELSALIIAVCERRGGEGVSFVSNW